MTVQQAFEICKPNLIDLVNKNPGLVLCALGYAFNVNDEGHSEETIDLMIFNNICQDVDTSSWEQDKKDFRANLPIGLFPDEEFATCIISK